MATKTEIAEKLYPAYHNGDRQTLKYIAERLLPDLAEKTSILRRVHRAAWFKNNNVIGWQNLDVRYGGVIFRCDTAQTLIYDYLNGNIEKIEELEEPRLRKGLSGFIHYSGIATVNLKT
jgi:hypothetical protein